MTLTTKRRIVMCLDGTWNSTYAKGTRDDGTDVAKPSNVLKLARAVKPVADDGTTQIVYYDTGIGGEADNDSGISFFKNLKKKRQGAWGLGFVVNVEEAVTFLANNCQPNGTDEIYAYGFSRGAATARAIVKFIDWMGGVPTKSDAYYIPEFFEAYQSSEGSKTCEDVKQERGLYIGEGADRRLRFKPFTNVKIKVLGVWDTVYSLGGQMLPVGRLDYHIDDVPPAIVENAYHALAIDESRGAFAPAVWRDSLASQNLLQMWFPGVHSNVGGGYPKDGMANVALKWMVTNSQTHGLEVDQEYLDYYRPYEFDRLYKSSSLGYSAMDFVLSKESGREFTEFPTTTNQLFHPSILSRMLADETEFGGSDKKSEAEYETGLYRPDAIKALIKKQPDQVRYCENWFEQEWFPGEYRALDEATKGRIRDLLATL